MFDLLKRLFGARKRQWEPGSQVEELWIPDLEGPAKGRFLEIDQDSYAARYSGASLELELRKNDLFAWTEAPLYRHADSVVEGSFEFESGGAHSAAGFLFRYIDERNFYAALVSNKGYFRLDVVFNGKPRPLIAWTEVPSTVEDNQEALDFSLRIIARGSHFTLCINDAWAAEAADDSFRSGHYAFAAQCYGGEGEKTRASKFFLRSCFAESRPIEVETWYYRWNYYIIPDSLARRRLAETLFAMGEYLAAAIQVRKIERRRELDSDELFLKAEIALRLELRDEAEAALDACLVADPGRQDAAEEKANILYLQGRNLELRDTLARLLPAMPDNARLLCLSGHARFALGDFTGAAADYHSAATLDPEQALFHMNEARAWDQARRRGEAADAYLAAAKLFYAQEADDDLALALHRLAALRPRSPELRTLRAKTLFRLGKKEEAYRLLGDLAAKGSEDSAIHYLLGIMLSERGERARALERFARALELEGDCALYAFRYAETLFLLDGNKSVGSRSLPSETHDPISQAISRALELGPRDGWTLNLAGQEALSRGDLAAARGFLETAHAALPGTPEPAVNLAAVESLDGRLDAALRILESFPENAACRNEAGNALVRHAEIRDSADREDYLARAAREYERACALNPDDIGYRCNLAAVQLELERYSDAEIHIRKALDSGQEPRAFLLAGDLGLVYGDRVRAEAAYRLGLELSPKDGALLFALGRCYLGAGNLKKAEECRRKLQTADPERGSRLATEIENKTTESLDCASCGRRWRVPRELPAQSGSSIRAMPPDDSPAGACPACGKIYCIACRKESLYENRFTCPDCGETLKLSDNRLRWLVREHLKREHAARK